MRCSLGKMQRIPNHIHEQCIHCKTRTFCIALKTSVQSIKVQDINAET